jgi:hypothetical protein
MEMQPYIGTKFVDARQMTLGDYNNYRGWQLPEGEDPAAPGYLVEYKDGGRPNDPRHRGYISWSPKDVFQAAYRSANKLPFGMALEAMKLGKKVMRLGWNGKGMFLYLVSEGRYPPSTVAGREIADRWSDGLVPYRPYIAMFTVDKDVVPWVASQSDLLMDDWMVLG